MFEIDDDDVIQQELPEYNRPESGLSRWEYLKLQNYFAPPKLTFVALLSAFIYLFFAWLEVCSVCCVIIC